MAGFKKVMLTERENSITQNVSNEFSRAGQAVEQNFDASYSAKKLNELYNEFDSIALDDMTANKVETMPVSVSKTSTKTKIYLTAGAFIALLLMFLVIYNFVVINSLNGGIKLLQDEVTYKEYQVASKANTVNNLTDSSTVEAELIENGYVQIDDNNMIVLDAGSASSSAQFTGKTNWFDAFCNFISNVFGG